MSFDGCRRRANPSDIAALRIPASSRDYLIHVGLPDEEILGLRFNFLGTRLPRLEELAPRVGFESVPNDGGAYCLGLKCDVVICIDEHSGSVYCVDLAREEPRRFLNSRVECLGDFLEMYVSHCHDTSEAPDADIDRAVLELERRMHGIDPEALDDPGHWWPLILEQMKDGLL